MNDKGQSILAEHVIIFFVVIASLIAMTAFVRRGFEARIHDARNYMIDSFNSACDANCQAAANSVGYSYEPYYAQILSDVERNANDTHSAARGNPGSIGAIYNDSVNEATRSITTSVQLPPECADGVSPKPSYCGN